MTRIITRRMATLTVGWLLQQNAVIGQTVGFRQGVDGYTETSDAELRGGKVLPDAFPKG
jgi:hypothetical protein